MVLSDVKGLHKMSFDPISTFKKKKIHNNGCKCQFYQKMERQSH